jgi:hypothetical protein
VNLLALAQRLLPKQNYGGLICQVLHSLTRQIVLLRSSPHTNGP